MNKNLLLIPIFLSMSLSVFGLGFSVGWTVHSKTVFDYEESLQGSVSMPVTSGIDLEKISYEVNYYQKNYTGIYEPIGDCQVGLDGSCIDEDGFNRFFVIDVSSIQNRQSVKEMPEN